MIGPSLISLDVDRDGYIYVAEVGGGRFKPDDWGAEWTPCLPPRDVQPSPLDEMLATLEADEQQLPRVEFTPEMIAELLAEHDDLTISIRKCTAQQEIDGLRQGIQLQASCEAELREEVKLPPTGRDRDAALSRLADVLSKVQP